MFAEHISAKYTCIYVHMVNIYICIYTYIYIYLLNCYLLCRAYIRYCQTGKLHQAGDGLLDEVWVQNSPLLQLVVMYTKAIGKSNFIFPLIPIGYNG